MAQVEALAAKLPTPPLKEAKLSPSPQSSDAENVPPLSYSSTRPQPLASPVRPAASSTPHIATTLTTSPLYCGVTQGALSSMFLWTAVDLETVLVTLPSSCYEDKENTELISINALSALTSPEKKMSMEESIFFNTMKGEEQLRHKCERMVGVFEGKELWALHALECSEIIK